MLRRPALPIGAVVAGIDARREPIRSAVGSASARQAHGRRTVNRRTVAARKPRAPSKFSRTPEPGRRNGMSAEPDTGGLAASRAGKTRLMPPPLSSRAIAAGRRQVGEGAREIVGVGEAVPDEEDEMGTNERRRARGRPDAETGRGTEQEGRSDNALAVQEAHGDALPSPASCANRFATSARRSSGGIRRPGRAPPPRPDRWLPAFLLAPLARAD